MNQQKRQSRPQPQPKPKIELMELLAFNATASSRKLLLKYGRPDAKGYGDLQEKLTDLYKSETDKLAIEKDLAAIHPHRDFILKYLAPAPVETKIILPEPTSAAAGQEQKINQGPASPLKDEKFLIAAVAIVGIVGIIVYATKNK